ncbi:MAG: hypothetical protein IJ781_10770 [Atopobiaceae bacterium]|nr:hypothetical protein [Atopobiaceae bacterium]
MANRSRKKRRSAWASITEVRRGEVYRIRYWAKGADGQYKRRSKTIRGTRLDAERARSELMLDHSEDAPCPTVGQAWEKWVLPDLERRVDEDDLAPKSLEQYRSAWRRHVEPAWGGVACDSVRPLAVQQWISQMGRSQASSAMQVLSKVMDYAVRYEFCVHNPMRERYLMPSASTVDKHDPGIWDARQLMAEWDSCRGEWFEAAFLLAAFGGMRVGETLGPLAGEVEAQRIDGVDVCTVPVLRQMPNRGKEPVARLKTGQSQRVAVVVGPAASRLAELAAATPADWPLTHDGAGGWQNQTRLSRSWSGAHPFRNLRNSFETWQRYDLRAPRWLTKRLMGHKGEDVADLYYDRPDGSRLAEIVADLYRERPIFG